MAPSGPRVAVTIFPTTETPTPGDLARMAESREIEALCFPEHTHVPLGPVEGHPGGARELPAEYARSFDPLTSCAWAAAATTRLKVGTAVCLLPQRDPIITAKEVATIDHLSDGRFFFGVGAGWSEPEMRNHGVDPARRHLILRERVEAMTAIWTQDEPAYEGETLRFGPMLSWPKPRQSPRPPVLLGGSGPRAAQRALEWADGWMPHTESGGDQSLLDRIAGVRARAAPGFEITLAMSPTHPARMEAYRVAGVNRFLFQLPTAGREAVEARLDKVVAAAAALA